MYASRDSEGIGGVTGVNGAVGREGAYDLAVYFHREGLCVDLTIVPPLGGSETDGVGAGGEVHRLADAALSLQEGDLRALRSIGVAGGEAAAVTGHARIRAVSPR